MATGKVVDRSGDEVESARLEAKSAFASLLDAVRRLPDGLAVDVCSDYEQQLAAERLLAVARLAGSSGDVAIDRRRARNTMSAGRGKQLSGRSVNRDARRAAAVAANERLGEQLASGSITPDAIDALSKAADDKSGEIPAGLVDAVSGMAPDQASRVVEDHLESAADAEDVEREYRRARQARRAYHYDVPASGGRPAMSGIAVEGPKADIARWWAQISSSADAAYQAAGGRDRPTVQHSSFSSRLYDAVADALAGRRAPGSGRPSVIVTVDAESLFGDSEQQAVATQLGAGPIPESLLADYVQSGSVSAVLRRLDGAPLWFGRARRHSTDAQFLALAVRDRGCVLCRAGVDRCQAHHLMPWSAPGRGRTDVDQLALLCQQCRRDLHHRNHTLQVKVNAFGKRIWSSRPATPEETPAARPPQHRKRHRKRE